MGATRTELYSEDINSLARKIHALAHPARLMIIRALLRGKFQTSDDFKGAIGLSQPTISQHLKELKEAGLINVIFVRRKNRFYLDKTCCTALLRELDGLLNFTD